MSWGERSCKKPCRCPELCTIEYCTVNCISYKWDGKTKPDSVVKPNKPKDFVNSKEWLRKTYGIQ